MSIPSVAVETIPLADLKPAEYNPRHISDASLAGLRVSVERFGLVEPIVWNKRTGHVVGGHQRLRVLEQAGATDAAVMVVDLSAGEEKALNVALNNPHIAGEFTDDLQDILAEIEASDAALFEALRLDELVEPEQEATGDGDSQLGDVLFRVLVECDDEDAQTCLLEEFKSRGLRCQPVMV